MAKIVSCEPVGEEETYDLELDHDDHQYFLDNGVLTSNSHSVSYSIVSFQCAWLFNYYPDEWAAAYLDSETEKKTDKKEQAISTVEGHNFNINLPSINKSSDQWEVGEEENELLQPITDVKGLGETAYEQIMEHRPFESIEHLALNEDIDYRPMNKKVIGSMIRTTVLDELKDERFNNRKHFWKAVADDNPDNEKQLRENIEEYADVDEFTRNEYIDAITNLVGVYPLDRVMSDFVRQRLDDLNVPPLGMIDPVENGKNLCWFVVKDVEVKTTRKNNRPYWLVKATDSTKKETFFNIWNAKEDDPVYKHHSYMADLDYDSKWGYDAKGFHGNIKLLGE